MNEIQKLRARTGLSQSKFAKKFHINYNTLQAWEVNKNPTPDSILFMVATILDYEDKYGQIEPSNTKN